MAESSTDTPQLPKPRPGGLEGRVDALERAVFAKDRASVGETSTAGTAGKGARKRGSKKR